MARVMLNAAANFKIVYVVDQAVGRACPNRRDDVLLVQFFLRVASEGPKKARLTTPGGKPLQVDGMWGPSSQAMLDRFIAVENVDNPEPHLLLVNDGRVDPTASGTLLGSKSKSMYTILALNVAFTKARSQQALQDITTDPLFPQELRRSIKIV